MNWTAVTGAHHYDVRIRELGNTAWTLYTVISPEDSLFLNNLSQNTTYEWEVRSACSTDSSSVSSWSTTEVFNTADECAIVLNEFTSAIGQNSATFNWDAVPGAWGYVVRIAEPAVGWGVWTYDTVTTNTYNAIGLSCGTQYYWQVASMCSPDGSNTSQWSDNTTFAQQLFTTDTCGGGSRIIVEEAGDLLNVNLNIYPNPTRGLFNITFVSEEVNDFEINIVDAFGQMVSREDKQQFVGEYTKLVDLSNWPRGIYIVQIKTQDSIVSKRLVLQ